MSLLSVLKKTDFLRKRLLLEEKLAQIDSLESICD